jgi:sulfur carrier protein
MFNLKNFFLNGHKYNTQNDLTLFELVNYFNCNTSLLVLEYNHKVCDKTKWDKILLKNNDKIEIVTIVGGG